MGGKSSRGRIHTGFHTGGVLRIFRAVQERAHGAGDDQTGLMRVLSPPLGGSQPYFQTCNWMGGQPELTRDRATRLG